LNTRSERRHAPHGTLKGGRRAADPPLTTRDCANWIGCSTDYIRDAIEAGELVSAGRVGRTLRIPYDSFVAFCQRKGYRVPQWRAAGTAATAGDAGAARPA
jgi:excisionase family DNA binding protein